MPGKSRKAGIGRGAQLNPANSFEQVRCEEDFTQLAQDELLPGPVQPIFLDWLERCFPARKSLIESRIRQIRGGQLNDANFGSRMSGQGVLAEQIRQTFQVFAAKYDLSGELPPLDTSHFRRPGDVRQRRLF